MLSLDDTIAIRHVERAYTGTKWIAQARAELAKRFPTVRLIITEKKLSNPSSDPVLVIQINRYGTVKKVYGLQPYARGSWSQVVMAHISLVACLACFVAFMLQYMLQYRKYSN